MLSRFALVLGKVMRVAALKRLVFERDNVDTSEQTDVAWSQGRHLLTTIPPVPTRYCASLAQGKRQE
jgi:hypothetical protein